QIDPDHPSYSRYGHVLVGIGEIECSQAEIYNNWGVKMGIEGASGDLKCIRAEQDSMNSVSGDFVEMGTSTSQTHVLAVDDSIVDRKVIEKLLKKSSYKVTTVDSGTRALEFLGLDDDHNTGKDNGLKVNMIITDYCMPGMTGYELLKRIKESSKLKEIPVFIMSSENIPSRMN
ncbi:hypothetical protein KI387_018043, partial [Taxus chinensis]